MLPRQMDMERMAIIVDGEQVAGNSSVAFPVDTIGRPRRPVAGLAIAVMAAVVSMGSIGPHLGGSGDAAQLACGPATTGAVAADVTVGTPPATPESTQIPWWLLPQVAEWVDPATGRSMQAAPVREPRVVHDRHLVR